MICSGDMILESDCLRTFWTIRNFPKYGICAGTAAGGSTSTTALDWHLKGKDTEYVFSPTKNYCITVSMKKKNQLNS